MRTLFSVCAAVLLFAIPAAPQRAVERPQAGQLLVVLPFANTSNVPGIEWIGEAFAELIGQRVGTAAPVYIVGRDERAYAFERLGVPTSVRISKATMYRIAQEMDVDYVISGTYNYDGKTFSARAQLMDARRARLYPETAEAGALTQLNEIQNALSWNLLRALDPSFQSQKTTYLAGAPPIRLDALENFVKAILATDSDEKASHFKEALKLYPDYGEAALLLGKTYLEAKEYEQAALWLGKVPAGTAEANEANFYRAIADFHSGNLDRAEAALTKVANSLPLIEVYNNLGVVAARRGKKEALEYFQKAASADSSDADYKFNLGVSLFRNGDPTAAAKKLRELLRDKPQDTEAKQLLEWISTGTTERKRIPNERLKRNFDESSYRQLALEIRTASEARFAGLGPAKHAASHVERGMEMLQQGLTDAAETDFREAILLDPTNARAHLGLARIHEGRGDDIQARNEATAAAGMEKLVEAYLILARLDVKANKGDSARDNVERALQVEPGNSAALAMRQSLRQVPR